MVLIAASICTKPGKVILSRQFVEMSKPRIEGLLAAFPKLVSSEKQHTFVETDSVRYVYQPMDKIYMLLITTKASNILEDLETLRLFSRVVPEYCRSMEEQEISDNAFNLIFAFDEIVALGYRENVNLAQIRTFVEMDSHEEKVYQAVRQTQEKEAKNKMREKAKELQRARLEMAKKGFKSSGGYNISTTSSVGSGTYNMPSRVVHKVDCIENSISAAMYPNIQKPTIQTKSLKLGSKMKNVDSFVDQLQSEGQVVTSLIHNMQISKTSSDMSTSATEQVHIKQEEKFTISISQDGRLRAFDLSGIMTLRITHESRGKISIALDKIDYQNGIQLQPHPNVDKELFKSKSVIRLKNAATKSFPINTDVGVLKWRFHTVDEGMIPLIITSWPSDNGEGGCDVTIEYELLNLDMELNNVTVNIPIPHGSSIVVSDNDGDYNLDDRKHILVWSLPIVNKSNAAGSLEYSISSCIPSNIYPIEINFVSKSSFAKLKVTEVSLVDDDTPLKFSQEALCYPEKYEIS